MWAGGGCGGTCTFSARARASGIQSSPHPIQLGPRFRGEEWRWCCRRAVVTDVALWARNSLRVLNVTRSQHRRYKAHRRAQNPAHCRDWQSFWRVCPSALAHNHSPSHRGVASKATRDLIGLGEPDLIREKYQYGATGNDLEKSTALRRRARGAGDGGIGAGGGCSARPYLQNDRSHLQLDWLLPRREHWRWRFTDAQHSLRFSWQFF
jgi:hypothetical protein